VGHAMTTAIDRHSCGFPWCTGTMWDDEHYAAEYTPATGQRVSCEDLTVGVVLAYDEAEDSGPRILLHISSLSGEVDTDAGPSPDEACAIAAKLIEAADEVDGWAAGNGNK
jgi:hypothetical protein